MLFEALRRLNCSDGSHSADDRAAFRLLVVWERVRTGGTVRNAASPQGGSDHAGL